MTEIKYQNYLEIARAAAAGIGRKDFFSGAIECEHEGFTSTLTTTLLIYRQNDSLPEGTCTTVTDIVPVWWEFSTVSSNGEKIFADFSFEEFRKHLTDYFLTEII